MNAAQDTAQLNRRFGGLPPFDPYRLPGDIDEIVDQRLRGADPEGDIQ